MILEADAAVIYSQYEAEVQGHYNLRKPGAQYIIIDAAGKHCCKFDNFARFFFVAISV